MKFQLISSQDPNIEAFTDQFLGLRTVFDEAKFPYWVLVDGDKVAGLIVVAREPRDLIQPVETPFVRLYIFKHNIPIIQRLLDEAKTLAGRHEAAFISCAIETKEADVVPLLEAAELSLFDESLKMICSLDTTTPPDTDLTFERIAPEAANLILDHLVPMIEGTPEPLIRVSTENLRQMPAERLNSILSQMEVILAKRDTDPIGIISLMGPTINLVAVKPSERNKGYGRHITQWALWHLAQEGHLRAWLRVSINNTAAVHVFEGLGFRTTNRVRLHLKKQSNFWKETL